MTAALSKLAPRAASGSGADRAWRWFEANGLPDARDEAWLYTPLAEVVDRLERAVPAGPQSIDHATVDRLCGRHGTRIVLVNGVHVPELSDGGTSAEPGDDAALHDPVDGFDALNRAAGNDAVVVRAEAGVEAGTPVHVAHLTVPGGEPMVASPRVVIDVGDNAGIHVVETFSGTAGDALTNASTVVTLGRAATLTHHRLQTEDVGAVHLGHTRVEQQADSRYRATVVSTGAAIARHAVDVGLHGEGAGAELDGLYLPGTGQRHDTVVTMDHASSRCVSNQHFRGVIGDRGRGSFSGHVIVRHGTVGTEAHQTNRNLLLSPHAQADSRPWLEIFAEDVRCDHGSATGRIDEEALFYLRSRGIPLAEARGMLVEAFAREITIAVPLQSLREQLDDLLRAGGH